MRNSMIALILVTVILLSGYVLVQAQDSGPSAKDLVRRARLAYLEGDLPAAIDLYAEAVRLAPENDDNLFNYTRILLYASRTDFQSSGYLSRAQDVAKHAVRIQPDSAKTQAAHALIYAETDLHDYAIETAQRAIQIDPTFAPAHVALSLAYHGQGDWQQAIRSAKQAIDLAPDSIDAHRALGLAYALQNEFESAIAEFELANELNPNLDFLYFELAPLYAASDDYDAALALYATVLERDPDNVLAHLRTCETQFGQRDDEAALANCNRALELDQSRPDVWRQLGMIHYLDRNYELAADSFAQCVTQMEQREWDSADRIEQCYYLQGVAHQLLDQCDQAEPLFLQALELGNLSESGRDITYEGMKLCEIEVPPTGTTQTTAGSPSVRAAETGAVLRCDRDQAWLDAPVHGQHLTKPIKLIGTAAGDDFADFHIEIRQNHPRIEFARLNIRGENPVINGTLGELDPSQLLAGGYRLQLVVNDSEGIPAASCEITVFIGGD